jgi:hypothetical protein
VSRWRIQPERRTMRSPGNASELKSHNNGCYWDLWHRCRTTDSGILPIDEDRGTSCSCTQTTSGIEYCLLGRGLLVFTASPHKLFSYDSPSILTRRMSAFGGFAEWPPISVQGLQYRLEKRYVQGESTFRRSFATRRWAKKRQIDILWNAKKNSVRLMTTN